MDDGMQISLNTGIGKYSLYLYNSLKKAGCNIDLDKTQKRHNKKTFDRISYLKYINSKEYRSKTSDYDILWYTNYAMPFIKNSKSKYAVTLADMVAYKYPKTLPFPYRLYLKSMIKNSVKKADILLTISESVKKEIIEIFPECESKIRCTWLGCYDGIKPLSEYPQYENSKLVEIDRFPFFLFVSTVEKRKNVGMVLKAFIKLKETCDNAKNYKLVIVGRPGYGFDEFTNIADSSGFSNDIIFSGYTSDSDCNRLYNHAKAFVFPTVYEGFGFAQIECMKCRLPIILSDIPVNREISREYGEFFSLDSIDALVDKMSLIADGRYDYDVKNELADQYMKDFDWDNIACVYKSIFQNHLNL